MRLTEVLQLTETRYRDRKRSKTKRIGKASNSTKTRERISPTKAKAVEQMLASSQTAKNNRTSKSKSPWKKRQKKTMIVLTSALKRKEASLKVE